MTHPELLETIDWLAEVRKDAVRGSWKDAARRLGRVVPGHEEFEKEEQAKEFVRKYFFELLESDRYLEATAIAWSRALFEQRPVHIKRIFDCLTHFDKVILAGASGMSKTYSAAGFFALDTIRDPNDTAIKFGSVNDTNLRGNLWSNLVKFHEECLFPVNMDKIDSRMRLKPAGARPDCGIDAVMFPKATESQGKIKGFHPKPFRPDPPHPKWGNLTRVRILLDETQNMPEGVEKDFGSPLSTIDEDTHVIKIVLTLNPEDEARWSVKLAEPEGGWDEKRMDELLDYTAKSGFRVCRLDGAVFENVVQRRVVFPGFLTYKGFSGYVKAGGELSKDYYVFGRGWPPPGRAQEVVIPSTWFEGSLGEPLFTGNVFGVAGADIAFDGDRAILGLGRYGMATGWMDDKGIEHRFDSRKVSGEIESRHCLVVDHLIEIMSRDSVGIGKEIKSWCEKQHIDPSFLIIDKTGNGIGVSSYLARFWSDQIIAINWKEAPTKLKILAEDKEVADVQTANKISEMHFTMRRWIQPTVRGFFINPLMQRRDELKRQCTTRHFRWAAGNRFEVESKDDFKKHAGFSPDENDAVIMMTMIPRVRTLQLPAMMDELVMERPPPLPPENQAHDPGDVTPELESDTHWVNPELELTGVRFHDEEG